MPAFGRIPQFDQRSRAFPARTLELMARPPRRLHRLWGSRLDQGDVGACTGFAFAHARNSTALRRAGEEILRGDDALQLYSAATRLDPFPGEYPPEDTGSSGLAVCKAGVEASLISRYEWAFGLDHVLAALVFRPVIVGTWWYESMMTPDSSGYVRVTGRRVGGHEWCLIGYEDVHKVVHARNSWGPGWGQRGNFVIGYEDLSRLLNEDGDAAVPVTR